jgi:hypothetical protein
VTAAGKSKKKACDAANSTKKARRLAPLKIAERRVDSDGRATRAAADEAVDHDQGTAPGRRARVTPAAMSSAREGVWRVGAPEPVGRRTSSAPEATRRGADEVPLRQQETGCARRGLAQDGWALAPYVAAAARGARSTNARRGPRRVV